MKQDMVRNYAFAFAWLLCLYASAANAAMYYIDDAGNDANTGTSAEAPWKTLAKVNATTFAPGDKILFKSGGAWRGQLAPKGSGEPGKVITIDRYSDGKLPLIKGEGTVANKWRRFSVHRRHLDRKLLRHPDRGQ